MARERERQVGPAYQAPLPAAYWTRLADVRVPGTAVVIDLVLVGPSGVHVVLDHPDDPLLSTAVPRARSGVEDAMQRAAHASAAVATLLPERYRSAVLAEVCLLGTTGVVLDMGSVLIGSADVLWQTWRHRARVLSTSEVAVVAGLLDRRLERVADEPPPRRSLWSRSWRWLTGAAAAGAAAVSVWGVPEVPWR